ncbi:MAG: BtrH N-terminal domain-containing protein [Bacteroidetes bacterium]|nr:BtrH N-terminal domain-containing protein [Bacteroidota bacterium]
MKVEFTHIQSAHCENGVTTNLLKQAGVHQMTEPLAFGIGSGLFYIQIPFLKINNGPAIAFRNMPGAIFKRTCQELNIPVIRKKFSSPQKAQAFLEEQLLTYRRAVGCQVGVYYLPYFPKEYRFHFNAHNIIVYGKEADTYFVSDPVMETVTTLSAYDLQRVRFAKGALAPKGQIYFPKGNVVISSEQMKKAIKKGIKKNAFYMLKLPGNIAGVRGIKRTANQIKTWKDTLGLHTAGLYLAQLVRMQEEIGTGGGGFRFIYAAFLQEAHAYLKNDSLLSISESFTQSGDIWRKAAAHAAGIYKGRLSAQADFNLMADYLHQISEIEKEAFTALSKLNPSF